MSFLHFYTSYKWDSFATFSSEPLYFQWCLYNKQPWKTEIVYLGQTGLLSLGSRDGVIPQQRIGVLPLTKVLGSLSSGLLSCKAVCCVCQVTWSSSRYCGSEIWRRSMINADTLNAAIGVFSSFVSDPGILFPLPASMKLWEATLLAYK